MIIHDSAGDGGMSNSKRIHNRSTESQSRRRVNRDIGRGNRVRNSCSDDGGTSCLSGGGFPSGYDGRS